jgi:hypothetical protein
MGINLPKNIHLKHFNISKIEESQLAKSKSQPHRNLHMTKHSTKPYEMLHIDFKHVGIKSWGGAIGFSTIVDDYSRRIHIIPLQSKKDFVPKFIEWVSQNIQSQGFKINKIRCDNGGEIKNYQFNNFLTVISAKLELTSTYSPQSDGIAERGHQTILSIANTLRLGGDFPPAAWAELTHTACFIHSHLPSKSNPKSMSPHQLIHKSIPDVSFMRTIGCKAYVHKFKPLRDSILDTRATKGKLIGYANRTKGYRILMSTSPLQIIETMHVTFAEDLENAPNQLLSLPDREGNHYFASYPLSDIINPTQLSDLSVDLEENDLIPDLEDPGPVLVGQDDHIFAPEAQAMLAPVLRKKRGAVASRYQPIDHGPHMLRSQTIVTEHANMARHQAHAVRQVQAATLSMPTKLSFSTAVTDPMIKEAMTNTILELYDINAIELVDLKPNDRLIKSVWIHQPKTDADGKLIKIKSRICPQGFRFRQGVDFDADQIASHAPHVQTLLIGLTLEAQHSMFTKHIDVTNCFQRYSELSASSRILLRTPDGFFVPPGKAIRMINALQGSPQAGKIWEEKAEAFLLHSLNFKQSNIDPSFYWRWTGDIYTQIIRSTDDFRISSMSETTLEEVTSKLMNKWVMTEQVNKTWNGMAISHNRQEGVLTISMKRDIEAMLIQFGMAECKPEKTPAAPSTKLAKPTSTDAVDPEAAKFPYREAVGALLWFGRTGRPDILYSVNQVTKFCFMWDHSHVTAVKRIMRYLKATLDLKLTFRKSKDPHLVIYADSDFASEPEANDKPMCSTSGMVAYSHGIGAIFAAVNLEKTISLSTAEAEYKAITRACKFAAGVIQFYEEIGFPFQDPTPIFNDNQAAIAMAKQQFCTSATRHMKIKYHFIREQVKEGIVSLSYCPTGSMVADIMTKALDRILFERFRDMLLDGKDMDGAPL